MTNDPCDTPSRDPGKDEDEMQPTCGATSSKDVRSNPCTRDRPSESSIGSSTTTPGPLVFKGCYRDGPGNGLEFHERMESSPEHHERFLGPTYAQFKEKESLFARDRRLRDGRLQARMEIPTVLQEQFWESTGDDNGKDVEVCKRMSELAELVVAFANIPIFHVEVPKTRSEYVEEFIQKAPPDLNCYVSCLALTESKGEDNWTELLTNNRSRSALIVGILGRALKKHVFDSLWFGASKEAKEAFEALETSAEFEESVDGFWRTEQRASLVRKYLHESPSAFGYACDTTRDQLFNLLLPLAEGENPTTILEDPLLIIIGKAAVLSRLMRLAPDVVFHSPSTFKDEEFEPARMECLNLSEMLRTSPFEAKIVNGIEEIGLRPGRSDEDSEAIVQVVCFPGLVAYRRGGGLRAKADLSATAHRDPAVGVPMDIREVEDRFGQVLTGDEGFRSKVVYKSLVYLQWSKQSCLTREAGTSAYIEAIKNGKMDKYEGEHNGSEDLRDIAAALKSNPW